MKKFITESVRKHLNELEGVTYKYGCVMLGFDIPKDKWDKIQDLIEDDDIYKGDGDGRETIPHVTILYGIHKDVEDKDVKEIIDTLSPPEITLEKIGIFENDESDVIKFDIRCESLNKMNKLFKELPHTSSYPDYKPHTTIAFVKAGKGKKYIQSLDKDDVLVLKPNKIIYSKADGTKHNYDFKNK